MRHKKNIRNSLPVLLSATVFVIIFLTMSIIGFTMLFLLKAGIVREPSPPDAGGVIFLMAVLSIAVGTTIAFLVSRVPLRPLHTMISAMRQVSGGNFKLRLQPKGTGGDLYELYSSFNAMVSELDSVEILREDFINHFSHEFKTPLVSIRGFAKMLKNDKLSDQQRDEYLGIIIDESDRLASLSSSILMLSRLENQSILSDASDFPIGEQLRRCILILQSRWEGKHLSIAAEIPDVSFYGSETLLAQVWMNLLDNAIKFTPEAGRISVELSLSQLTGELGSGQQLVCCLRNSGQPISLDGLSRIFEKFYQDDPSRATAGNGLGLSIVSRVLSLHGGMASVCNVEEPETGVEFTVTLPMKKIAIAV